MGGGGVGRPYGASLGEDVGFAVTRGWGVWGGLLPGSASSRSKPSTIQQELSKRWFSTGAGGLGKGQDGSSPCSGGACILVGEKTWNNNQIDERVF